MKKTATIFFVAEAKPPFGCAASGGWRVTGTDEVRETSFRHVHVASVRARQWIMGAIVLLLSLAITVSKSGPSANTKLQ